MLEASVSIENVVVGRIDKGLVVFLGIGANDTLDQVEYLAKKLINLRIFPDSQGKMNLSLLDLSYSVLLVSQFTLYGNCDKGNRPSFIDSAPPAEAIPLYEAFIQSLKEKKIHTETGQFGADMQVSIVNDGPVTFMIEKE